MNTTWQGPWRRYPPTRSTCRHCGCSAPSELLNHATDCAEVRRRIAVRGRTLQEAITAFVGIAAEV